MSAQEIAAAQDDARRQAVAVPLSCDVHGGRGAGYNPRVILGKVRRRGLLESEGWADAPRPDSAAEVSRRAEPEKQERVTRALGRFGLARMAFHLDDGGAQVLVNSVPHVPGLSYPEGRWIGTGAVSA